MENPTDTATAASETITLDEPILRGETKIGSVQVRRPFAGEMSGLGLRDVFEMDVNAMLTLLPRITIPSILQHELAKMNPADFLALSTEASGFLLPRAVRPASPEQ